MQSSNGMVAHATASVWQGLYLQAEAANAEIRFRFGYCTALDCLKNQTAMVWLTGFEPVPTFDYKAWHLPAGSATLVVCVAAIYRDAIKVWEECAAEMAEIPLHTLGRGGYGYSGSCTCFERVVSPIQALGCLLSCRQEAADTAQELGLVSAVQKLGGIFRTDARGYGKTSSGLEALRIAQALLPDSGKVLCNVMTAVRLATARIVPSSLGDSGSLHAVVSTVLNHLSFLTVAYTNLGIHESSKCCDFIELLQVIINGISDIVLQTMQQGDKFESGHSDVRILLSALDVDVHEDLMFVMGDPGTDGSQKRLRRSLADVYSSPRPEIGVPAHLIRACQSFQEDFCPRPLLLTASYSRESSFFLKSLGTSTFLQAAAEFVGVGQRGLAVQLVSGTLGLRFPHVAAVEGETASLLGSTSTLWLPLDSQVSPLSLYLRTQSCCNLPRGHCCIHWCMISGGFDVGNIVIVLGCRIVPVGWEAMCQDRSHIADAGDHRHATGGRTFHGVHGRVRDQGCWRLCCAATVIPDTKP